MLYIIIIIVIIALFFHPRGNHFETKHMPRARARACVTNNAIRSRLVYIFAPTLPPLITAAAVFCHGNAVVPVHLFRETDTLCKRDGTNDWEKRDWEKERKRREERDKELES